MKKLVTNSVPTYIYSSDSVTYPLTYATKRNTWTDPDDAKATIDYIFAKRRNSLCPSSSGTNVNFKKVMVEDLKTTTNNVSFSDHNSVFAQINLGCSVY